MAIEIGLHRQSNSWRYGQSDLDTRQRVFWAAYALEITVAFNLGRPPSITEEHIDVEFPNEAPDTSLMLFHVRHRQIQCTMLREVYCISKRLQETPEEDRAVIIERIQAQLDSWRDSLKDIYDGANSRYPPQYVPELHSDEILIFMS